MPTRRGVLSLLFSAPFAGAQQSGLPAEPADLTVAEALTLIRGRKLTPLELTESCLQRIERLNPRLNAFITVLADAARRRARSLWPADAAHQPLHGVPIALKDLYDTAGVRTTAGSALWRDRVPADDAEVVQRLQRAGAVITGKTNMDEFAFNFTSETSAFGPSRNPWNPARSPGGSSGGSAIAVATGMSLASLGSDTGGSIRLPASLCGVTGYKPTYGQVPLGGVAPLAWSLDHAGPFTRTALDTALLHEVLCGRPVELVPVEEIRIGAPRGFYWQKIEPEVARCVSDAISSFGRLCRETRDVSLPPLKFHAEVPLPELCTTLIYAEAHTFHRDMLASRSASYHEGTRTSLGFGKQIDAATYINARREMERLRASAAMELFQEVDLLLTPASPGVAFPLGEEPDLIFLRNTMPWNLYGLPTISIPCGFGKDGLPVGLQLTGPPEADDLVLSAAAAFQQQTDFHRKRPAIVGD